VLVVAKPVGPTSHDVVGLVRRLSGTRRVGHGGTLDPFASGVLPLFLGRATRLVEYHLADRKAYRATVCFGATSSTDDLEGELVPADGPAPGRDAVAAALSGFLGEIEQRPPAYSAVKVSGRRAYALARAGESVELSPRRVRIDRLELVDWDGSDPARPVAVVEVECSAGTYVRSLARDLGAALGNGAYLGALERTASGPFTLDAAVALDEVRATAASGPDALRALLLPPDAGLEALPTLVLTPDEVRAVSRGQFIRPRAAVPSADAGPIRLRDEAGHLVGVGVVRDRRLVPEKVLVDAPVPAPRPAVASQAEPERDAVVEADVPAGSRRRPQIDLEAAAASEADPPLGLDPDPASPDDV
jgi:tRNA pseudouridine55 synthase